MKIQKLLNWLKQDTIAVDGKFIELDICVYEDDLEQQLQQAHREGWEQAKRKAYSLSKQHSLLSSTKSGEIEINELAIAIAALEYKEPI